MNNLLHWDTPPRLDEPELIDDESQPYSDFRESMTDVQNVNRYLGGTSAVTKQVEIWLKSAKSDPAFANRPVTFVDVATGSGDIPKAIFRLGKKLEVPIRIIGLDFSAPILQFAQEQLVGESDIRLVRGDAFQLPFADLTFDYALCSLAFHHFGYEQCVKALREMERVSSRGWLVNDLRRAWSAWVIFRAVSNLLRMNRMTKHDGPASVLRAYSLEEYHAMSVSLGLTPERDFRLRRKLFYRVVTIREK